MVFQTHEAIYNSIMMSVVPYLLILLGLVVVGVILLTPPVFVLAGSMLVLSRFSHFVSIDLSEKIENISAANNKKVKSKKPDVTGLIPPIPKVQVPWWTAPTLNFYFKLAMPVCFLSCSFCCPVPSTPDCGLACAVQFACFELPAHFCKVVVPKFCAIICPSCGFCCPSPNAPECGFACAVGFMCFELPRHFCTIVLPKCCELTCSWLRFCCPIPKISSCGFACALRFACLEFPSHFCKTVLPKCCANMCPSCCGFRCVLRFVCLEFPSLFFVILLPSFIKFYLDFLFVLTIFRSFSLAFPSLPGFNLPSFNFLPSFSVPRFFGNCGSTGDLGTILILGAAVFTSSVIITSDILVALFDRQRRGEMLTRSLEEEEKHENVSIWDLAKQARKVCVKAEAKLGAGALYGILWITGQIMNQATLSFAGLVPRLVAGKDDNASSNAGCTWGMWVSVRILHIYITMCTLVYFFKVLSGKVHKDGIYILSAALVQEESLFHCKQLFRVVALVRLCIGQFLLPMLDVGLTSEDAEEIDAMIRRKQETALRVSLTEDDVNDLKTHMSSRTMADISRSPSGIYAKLKNMFSAKKVLIEALTDMAFQDKHAKAQVSVRSQPDLRNFDDFRLQEFTALIRSRNQKTTQAWSEEGDENQESANSGCSRFIQSFVTVVSSPFTVMGDLQAKSAYVSERCCIWQSQLESVHKGTCFSVALTVLLIPLAGAFVSQSCKWMSEVPALLWSSIKEVAHYSFHWEHSDGIDRIGSDPWCQGAFGVVLLRMLVAGMAFFTADFWALFVCACINSLLCAGQNWLMTKNQEANSVRIASVIAEERPEFMSATAEPEGVHYSQVVPFHDEEREEEDA